MFQLNKILVLRNLFLKSSWWSCSIVPCLSGLPLRPLFLVCDLMIFFFGPSYLCMLCKSSAFSENLLYIWCFLLALRQKFCCAVMILLLWSNSIGFMHLGCYSIWFGGSFWGLMFLHRVVTGPIASLPLCYCALLISVLASFLDLAVNVNWLRKRDVL